MCSWTYQWLRHQEWYIGPDSAYTRRTFNILQLWNRIAILNITKNGKTILQREQYMALLNIQCVSGVYSLIFSVFEVCVLLCVLSSLPSHRNVSYEDLLGALQQYGTCQQRLGQWCADKRKVLKTERSEFKQSGEFRKVVTPAFLAVSLTTPLPHFCPSPGSLTD